MPTNLLNYASGVMVAAVSATSGALSACTCGANSLTGGVGVTTIASQGVGGAVSPGIGRNA